MNIITDLHEAAAGLRVLATINGLELDIQREQMRARADRLDQYADENARLRSAILDIDAHATGLGEDADGFVNGGYVISVGSLHRALGVVGHSSRKCRLCTAASCGCAEEHLRADTTEAMMRMALVQFAEWCGAEVTADTANYKLASIVASHLTHGEVQDWGAKEWPSPVKITDQPGMEGEE